jgi:AraC-like DNA-binding protein
VLLGKGAYHATEDTGAVATNVHSSYDSVLGKAQIELLSVHNLRRNIGVDRIGRWESRFLPSWTMVWSGVMGYDGRLPGKANAGQIAARPPRSWAFYAPKVVFEERLNVVEHNREFLYLFFAVSGALPPLTTRKFTLVLDPEGRITAMARDMFTAQQRGAPGDALAAHGLLLGILSEVLTCADEGAAGNDANPWRIRGHETEPRNTLLAAVDGEVLRSLASPPSREQLAKALDMSVSSLAHRFSAETGMTLVERIRWLRIREAKARLAEPGATVKAVAGSLGFSSPFYFSRVFKAVTDMTPEAYLAQCRM